jgi:uncharacterized protein YjiS (DUF1127 family)
MMETAMLTTSVLRPVRSSRPRLTMRGLMQTLVIADARYRAAAQFAKLDDHLLRDIGVSRGDALATLRRMRNL